LKKLAITINRNGSNNKKLFTNGIHQNIFTLQKLLHKAGKFDVCLIFDVNPSAKTDEEDMAQFHEEKKYLAKSFPGVKAYHRKADEYYDLLKELDVLIEAGFMYDTPRLKKIRSANPKIKIASLFYGNLYIDYVERLVNNSPSLPPELAPGRDAVWVSPHFKPWLGWFKTMLAAPSADIAPYVWSSEYFQELLDEKQYTRESFPKGDKRKIAIVEPNLGTVKTCTIPVAIVENLHGQDPAIFEYASVFNGIHLKENPVAKSLFVPTAVVRERKLSFEKRYSLVDTFSKYAGLLLSHQHCCALNYVYLEALYLDIPMVHNSPFFKEVGYYYDEFDVEEGARQLKLALEDERTTMVNGDKTEEYLWRYSPENPQNVDGYVKLVESLLGDLT